MIAMIAFAAAAGITAISIRQADPVVQATREDQFDEAWNDTMKVTELKKADLLRIVGSQPKPVVTERVHPDPPASMPPVILPSEEEDKPPVVKRRRHAAVDVCRGKGKRYTKGGKSWRCRR